MKNLSFQKLLFTTMLVMTGILFTNCVDDNDDTEAPYLKVSPTTLVFSTDGIPVEGSQSSFEISTNRHWKATVMNDVSWVTLSKMEGDGSQSVQVSIPEGITGEAKVLIELFNKVGVLMKEEVTIRSGNVLPETFIYTENFGTTAPSKSPYPFVDEFTDWVKSGEGSGTVTYTGSAASLRQSGKLSAGYVGASGADKLFFGASANFIINKITLKEEQTNLKLTFGGSYYNGTTQDGVFKPEKFHFYLSVDGAVWSDAIPYEIQKADEYWVFATANFTLKYPSTALYIKFTADEASVFSIDDPTLKTGQGGYEVDFGTSEDVKTTISALNAMMPAVGGEVALDANYYFEAVVQNDVTGGNYALNNLMVASKEQNTAGNGITLYGSLAEPKTLGVNKGDIVKVKLFKNLTKLKNYNGMLEITGAAADTWATIEKQPGTATITPAIITPNQLAAYQGMTVVIQNASTTTVGLWANGNSWTTHKLTAGGTEFAVFCNKSATAFLNQTYKIASGNITGIAGVNNNVGQLIPRDLNDTQSFNAIVPFIVSAAPAALSFETAGGAKDIELTILNKGNNTLSQSGLSGILSAVINDSKVTVTANANTSPQDVKQTLKLTLSNGNDIEIDITVAGKPTGNETIITLDITTNDNYPAVFPRGSAEKLTGAAPYIFKGYEYIVSAPTAYYQIVNTGKVYLFLGKKGAYVELPAIANKKLTKVTVAAHAGAAKATKVGIADSNNTTITGGTPIVRDDVNYLFVFDQLSGTSVNTKYRILVDTDANAQFGGWTLTYE